MAVRGAYPNCLLLADRPFAIPNSAIIESLTLQNYGLQNTSVWGFVLQTESSITVVWSNVCQPRL